MTLLAFSGNSYILLGVMIALFFAVVFGFFTYRGSDINPHPSNRESEAPGSSGPSAESGMGRNPDSAPGDSSFDSHGMR